MSWLAIDAAHLLSSSRIVAATLPLVAVEVAAAGAVLGEAAFAGDGDGAGRALPDEVAAAGEGEGLGVAIGVPGFGYCDCELSDGMTTEGSERVPGSVARKSRSGDGEASSSCATANGAVARRKARSRIRKLFMSWWSGGGPRSLRPLLLVEHAISSLSAVNTHSVGSCGANAAG